MQDVFAITLSIDVVDRHDTPGAFARQGYEARGFAYRRTTSRRQRQPTLVHRCFPSLCLWNDYQVNRYRRDSVT